MPKKLCSENGGRWDPDGGRAMLRGGGGVSSAIKTGGNHKEKKQDPVWLYMKERQNHSWWILKILGQGHKESSRSTGKRKF